MTAFRMSRLYAGYRSRHAAGESPLRACAIAAIAISVCVISLWTRSPLTKGIPLCRPGRIEARRIEMLTTENPVSWGTEKEK